MRKPLPWSADRAELDFDVAALVILASIVAHGLIGTVAGRLDRAPYDERPFAA